MDLYDSVPMCSCTLATSKSNCLKVLFTSNGSTGYVIRAYLRGWPGPNPGVR